MQKGYFSFRGKDNLVLKIVRETAGEVDKVFRAHGELDLSLDPSRQLDFGLQLCFKGYHNLEPPVKQQKTPSCSSFVNYTIGDLLAYSYQ